MIVINFGEIPVKIFETIFFFFSFYLKLNSLLKLM